MKALAHDPEARYGSVEAFLDDIECYLDDRPVAASRPTLGYRARKYFRRHRVAATATVAVALSLVIGLGAALIGFSQARDAAREARAEAQTSNQMVGFLMRTLDTADPVTSRANPITVIQALDAASDGLLAATSSDGVEAVYVIRLRSGDVLELSPVVYAKLLHRLGTIQRELGNLAMATRLLQRAREVPAWLGTSDD